MLTIMKQLLLTLLVACTAFGIWAQPILVGHRGSGYGLENSEESFKKGIELGYQYLETDVKFSKDLKLVCSHDDNTTRLGGTKTLATSTLEELQSETLSQTRNGVKYTGRLCSMKEYLEICKEGGVGALIELKWTDGINSNDCSRIPLLIEQIEEVGMRKNCIILTSMKPCLEYIRTNYPDIELQFLTGQYWSNHFDWCVQWNIDVDIEAGWFDKSTVQKYHDKNLKVNMWTTNDEAGYKTYGNMGCDFITTDRIDGHNLPELNADINFPPNTVDYPNSSYNPEIKSNYDIDDITLSEYPTALAELNVKRAVKSADGWYVLAIDADNSPSLFYIANGEGEPYKMSLDGLTDGDIVLNNIAITADGKLVGCNLTIVSTDESTTRPWKTYIWDTPQSTAREFISTSIFSEAGNWSNGVIGNSFAVSGLEKDLKIYTTSRSISGTTYRVCGYETKNGELVNAVYALGDTYTADNWGDFDICVSPWSRNNIIVSAPGKQAKEYTFEWSGTRLPLSEYATFDNSDPTMLSNSASFVRYGAKIYALVPQEKIGASGLTAAIYDATSGISSIFSVTDSFNVCDSKPGYTASSIRTLESGNNPISIFIENVGIISANFAPVEPEPEPEDLKLQLDRLWIMSNTTGNHPGNIDGTDAQQGTAVNGRFFINNCNEKLIHIFDENGHIGTIPGGAGWGCARDDVGNIIVRNDKLTGNSHSFIIYPADVDISNPGSPIELTVDVPLSGQTNFINASGDVLNNGGYIYLFPNGQAAINIIEVANGQLSNVYMSSDISYQGSTAGYIYPLNNDRENWFYQVRSNAINRYSGGVNTEFMGGRTGTSAPQRNTSVGFAVIKQGGNYILIHNSGASYKGGFTVRDITMDKVIASVDPIGTLGYETGGNYSVGNWSIVECLGKSHYLVYQYCPANGIALYRLHNPDESGIETAEVVDNTNTIFTDGNDIAAPGANMISVYDLSGKALMTVKGDSANIGHLADGIYIVRTDLGTSRKIAH